MKTSSDTFHFRAQALGFDVCKFRNQHLKLQNFFDQTILRNFCLAFCFQISAFGNQVVKDSVAALTPDFCDRQCYEHS